MRLPIAMLSIGLCLLACQSTETPAPAASVRRPELRFRSIGGVSMGGYGAAYYGTRFGELFDGVAALGGPLDFAQTSDYIRREMIGGFLPEERGQMFHADALLAGVDTISSFSRSGYMEILQDIFLVAGNSGIFNPQNSYWPLGVRSDDPASIARARSCTDPHTLSNFYDYEYNNPDAPFCAGYPGAVSPNTTGLWPVITYCESKGVTELPYVYPDPAHADRPTEIGMAVDCNGNRHRDVGEPIIRQQYEPWRDTGDDGLYSADEPGYDPARNPDPNGDDYHAFDNSGGTEHNAVYDRGEPYIDGGLDGIVGASNLIDDPWEGNGQFDLNPNMQRTLTLSPRQCVRLFGPQGRRFYLDAGVKDSFRFDEGARRFVAELRTLGSPTTFVPDFNQLGANWGADGTPNRLDLSQLTTPNLYVEYGDRQLTYAQAVARGGDGGHIGTAGQVLERVLIAMQFVGHLYAPYVAPATYYDAPTATTLIYHSEILGADREIGITFPPGYGREGRKYPVLYFLHGHGMDPGDFEAAGALFVLQMAQGIVPPMLLVFPDGRGVRRSQGSFFVNHADTSGQDALNYADSMLHEIMPFVESNYDVASSVADLRAMPKHDEGCRAP